MTKKRDIKKDLNPSIGDYVHTGLRSGLSTAPFVGGPLAEFFSIVIAPPLEKRRDAWMIEIFKQLQNLEKQLEGFKIENLAKNESFFSLFLYCTQIAMRTHQKEKLKALKNAVINSAVFPDIEENQRWIFLNILDRYTPWHIVILKLYDTPRPVNDNIFPEPINLHKDFANKIVRDLNNDGLIYSGVTRIDKGLRLAMTTNLGKKFLNFFNDQFKN